MTAAPAALLSATVNVSPGSNSVSPRIVTATVLTLSPGAKVTKPEAARKSLPALAVPAPVAQLTLTKPSAGPDSEIVTTRRRRAALSLGDGDAGDRQRRRRDVPVRVEVGLELVVAHEAVLERLDRRRVAGGDGCVGEGDHLGDGQRVGNQRVGGVEHRRDRVPQQRLDAAAAEPEASARLTSAYAAGSPENSVESGCSGSRISVPPVTRGHATAFFVSTFVFQNPGVRPSAPVRPK